MPGLRLFGHTYASNELLGWRAWIPEMIWLAIGLVLTRSLKPAGQLFRVIGQDWTRLSFLLYGLLPVVMVITFDEVRAEEWILVLLGLILAGGALGYLRASGTDSQLPLAGWQRGAGVDLGGGVPGCLLERTQGSLDDGAGRRLAGISAGLCCLASRW